MNYWLDLFTGTTWKEFQAAGSGVTGFREHNWQRSRDIKKGDTFLCYLVGAKRWVGLLEVASARFRDDRPIWGEEIFPVRFQVKPLIMLSPEHGVPMEEFKGKLSFFEVGASPGRWSGWVRSSPTKYKKADGEVIAAAITAASQHPVHRPIDPRKLKRSANLYKVSKGPSKKRGGAVVAVPDKEEDETLEADLSSTGFTHTEIQWRILKTGSDMGLKIWAPRNDRGKAWNGHKIGDIRNLLNALPTQFDDATTRTIENIDALWLSPNSNAIIAAFEVEHTTSIYSGLLRMADLIAMQPNIEIKLYLVAPDERYAKFKGEVPRPTFASLSKPLHQVCGFIPYSRLCARLEEVRNVVSDLRPEFIDKVADFYDPVEDYEE